MGRGGLSWGIKLSMTCQRLSPCRKWDLYYIKQIAADLWPVNGPAQLSSICSYELDSAPSVKSDSCISVGFLDSQQTVLIGCHLAARNEEEKKTSQLIVKEAAQILWNTGAFCEANRNTGPDCAEILLRFTTHGFDAFNEGMIVQSVKHKMTFNPNKK